MMVIIAPSLHPRISHSLEIYICISESISFLLKQGSRIVVYKFCEYCLIVAKLGMQYIVLSHKQALELVRINKKFKNHGGKN